MLLKIFHGKLKEFLTIVPNYPEIKECHRILGSDNVHMKLVLKDQLHLQRYIDSIMEYGHTTTHLILSDITAGKTKLNK
ncbi:Lrp/AsnC ligand binding domain-containing protein [Algoriphagus jejuensis]